MPLKTRSVAILTGVLTATAVAGAAALATPATTSTMMGGGVPAHMAELSDTALAEMEAMMNGDATVGEMHRWMAEQGIDVGQMHRDMVRSGMTTGQMHGSMTPPAR